jgi:hypothetical protein
MKNKTRLFSLLAVGALALSVLSSCTPAQAVAGGNYIAGAQLVTIGLQNDPTAGPALQNLAAQLPDIASGKGDFFNLGVLNAQLQPIFVKAENAHPNNRKVYVAVGTLIATGSKLNGSNPTAYQGIVMAAAADFANGMNDSLKFNAGRASITDPPAVASAVAKTASVHQ